MNSQDEAREFLREEEEFARSLKEEIENAQEPNQVRVMAGQREAMDPEECEALYREFLKNTFSSMKPEALAELVKSAPIAGKAISQDESYRGSFQTESLGYISRSKKGQA